MCGYSPSLFLMKLTEISLVKERIERNQAALVREQRRIFWCNAYDQGNYVSIHSDKFKSREKKYKYY